MNGWLALHSAFDYPLNQCTWLTGCDVVGAVHNCCNLSMFCAHSRYGTDNNKKFKEKYYQGFRVQWPLKLLNLQKFKGFLKLPQTAFILNIKTECIYTQETLLYSLTHHTPVSAIGLAFLCVCLCLWLSLSVSLSLSLCNEWSHLCQVGMRSFDDGDAFDSGLSMVKVNEVSPAVQEQVDMEIKRLLQVRLEDGGGVGPCWYLISIC